MSSEGPAEEEEGPEEGHGGAESPDSTPRVGPSGVGVCDAPRRLGLPSFPGRRDDRGGARETRGAGTASEASSRENGRGLDRARSALLSPAVQTRARPPPGARDPRSDPAPLHRWRGPNRRARVKPLPKRRRRCRRGARGAGGRRREP